MDSDAKFRKGLDDLIDSALDIVFDDIMNRRTEVMAYNSKGVPIGLVKSQNVTIEEIQSAFNKFKEQNRK